VQPRQQFALAPHVLVVVDLERVSGGEAI